MAEQRCHVHSSDDEPAFRLDLQGFDVDAFIDQEFDSIAYDSEDEIANVRLCEMLSDFNEENASVKNCELVCKSTYHSNVECCDCNTNGLHERADSGSMVQDLQTLEKDWVRHDQNAEKEMVDSITASEMCQRGKLEKIVQNGHVETCGRDAVVSEELISDMCEDVGTCWKHLGTKLKIKASKIHNIDDEYKRNHEKATQLLQNWIQVEGCRATVGILETALICIHRKDIAEKLIGLAGIKADMPERKISDSAVSLVSEEPLHLNICCNLKVKSPNPVLLCINEKGEKYLAKKIDGETETPWDVMEILENEKVLEKVITALSNKKNLSKEQRRQESLKKASKEIEQLRERLKLTNQEPSEGDEKPMKDKYKDAKDPKDYLDNLLTTCERQCENLQGMFNGLIKLIGEVGPLEGNVNCLNELCNFTRDFQDQEKQFFPQIDDISSRKKYLAGAQTERYEALKKWRTAQKEQVEGIEMLLTSLIHQGKFKRKKIANRRSEPILGRILRPVGRRRCKTDSAGSKSLGDIHEEHRKDNISGPMFPRRMCALDRQADKAKQNT